MTTIQEHYSRLAEIIETAYKSVCQKLAGGSIEIYNEASLQLHLSTILDSLGRLYEFSGEERFVIELEKRIDGIKGTSKSNSTARCDIVISFVSKGEVHSQAFLELKYFKTSSDNLQSNEASKDNRFSLFMDLENLEHYRELTHFKKGSPLCYLIAIAQNKTYADPESRSVLKTGNGMMTDESKNADGVVPYSKRKPVRLHGNYKFDWTSYQEDLHCLCVKLQ